MIDIFEETLHRAAPSEDRRIDRSLPLSAALFGDMAAPAVGFGQRGERAGVLATIRHDAARWWKVGRHLRQRRPVGCLPRAQRDRPRQSETGNDTTQTEGNLLMRTDPKP